MTMRSTTDNDIHALLKRYWGYDSFRPMQQEIIESILSGADTLGLLPTGGGKSITFQVPAMAVDGLTLVVTPLISLMKDQVDNLMQHGIRAYFLHSGLSRRETRLVFDKCRLGKSKILYLSPEKLGSPGFANMLKELPVKLIVVDEAHCISQWGYDFRPSYLKIADVRQQFPDAPVLALTASATPDVVDDIMDRLQFHTRDRVFRRSFSRDNISYIVRYCEFKSEQLLHILRNTRGCGIVYTRSRVRTRELADFLRQNGITADFYHAGLSPEEKNEKQNRWKADETRIIVATNAFGMGIDKPDVRIVIHHDLPTSLEEYYQEAGRAGRDGLPSFAVVLATKDDKGLLSRRLAEAFPEKDYIREIYDRACVFLNISMGEGYNTVNEFNLGKFTVRNHLQPTMTHSALTLLTQAGYIEYTEEIATRSRLMVTMTRNELYSLQLDNETERIFQFILRNYTGIFADYEHISEPAIASNLNLTEETVYQALLRLSAMNAIHYVPHRQTPYIIMTRSREPSRDLIFPRTIYELRKKRMAQRIDAMKRFVFDAAECRVTTMLNYFGEMPGKPCGTCDVCRSHRQPHPSGNDNRQQLDASILYVCSQVPQGRSADYISSILGIKQETIIPCLRDLLDRGQLTMSTERKFITTPPRNHAND